MGCTLKMNFKYFYIYFFWKFIKELIQLSDAKMSK
jgi:hypothetical protein